MKVCVITPKLSTSTNLHLRQALTMLSVNEYPQGGIVYNTPWVHDDRSRNVRAGLTSPVSLLHYIDTAVFFQFFKVLYEKNGTLLVSVLRHLKYIIDHYNR